MDIEQKELLAKTGDISPEAIRERLIAARHMTGLQQNEIARALGVSKTTYHSQESRGAPSIKAMRYYYRQHRIDFNYLLHGDFAQLPLDVQERLFDALSKPSG
ncbi:XRE family transcriptional regulator [uncultured Ruegeria sp.]|uniref:helix-turn-helix domain-containing protein n=1 Tax=uncultured Ruegeria sp. TaxID=259304 RepID=UPI002619D7E3|nr:XRE family transcriptional regulator [uncultured Ruegeria sp.]